MGDEDNVKFICNTCGELLIEVDSGVKGVREFVCPNHSGAFVRIGETVHTTLADIDRR